MKSLNIIIPERMIGARIDASISEDVGVQHIVGKYQTVLELARETKSEIEGIEIPDDIKSILPLRLELI